MLKRADCSRHLYLQAFVDDETKNHEQIILSILQPALKIVAKISGRICFPDSHEKKVPVKNINYKEDEK